MHIFPSDHQRRGSQIWPTSAIRVITPQGWERDHYHNESIKLNDIKIFPTTYTWIQFKLIWAELCTMLGNILGSNQVQIHLILTMGSFKVILARNSDKPLLTDQTSYVTYSSMKMNKYTEKILTTQNESVVQNNIICKLVFISQERIYRNVLVKTRYFSDSPYIPKHRIVRRSGLPAMLTGVSRRNDKNWF